MLPIARVRWRSRHAPLGLRTCSNGARHPATRFVPGPGGGKSRAHVHPAVRLNRNIPPAGALRAGVSKADSAAECESQPRSNPGSAEVVLRGPQLVPTSAGVLRGGEPQVERGNQSPGGIRIHPKRNHIPFLSHVPNQTQAAGEPDPEDPDQPSSADLDQRQHPRGQRLTRPEGGPPDDGFRPHSTSFSSGVQADPRHLTVGQTQLMNL